MKDFALREFTLSLELTRQLRPLVLESLFEHIRLTNPEGATPGGPFRLTVTQAKEIVALNQPLFRERILPAINDASGPVTPLSGNFQMGLMVHDWMDKAARFLRREGAELLTQSRQLDPQEAFEEVWAALFQRKLMQEISGLGLLSDSTGAERANTAIECLKLWTKNITAAFCRQPPSIRPTSFFLDTEQDISAEIPYKGETLKLTGKPDLIILDGGSPCIIDYKYGIQGQLELQMAQLVLYGLIVETLKGIQCNMGRLLVFTPFEVKVPDAKYPPNVIPEVEKAFEGFIGNHQAVERVKVELTLARKKKDSAMEVNFMFCGPAGLGKTEIAKRVASALKGVPLVDLPADAITGVDDLIEKVDATFVAENIEVPDLPTEAGMDNKEYPPVVVFIDEIHRLNRKADEFLPMFEPNDRKAKGKKHIRDFKNATILAATTDRGKLPDAFLTRFRTIDLRPYSVEELVEILRPVFLKSGLPEPGDEALTALVQAGRLNPRVAKARADEFIAFHKSNSVKYPLVADAVAHIAKEIWGLTEGCLEHNDVLYLTALKDGRKGESALVGLLPVGKEEVTGKIEPYLMSAGYARQTSQGRELTEQGRLLLSRLGK